VEVALGEERLELCRIRADEGVQVVGGIPIRVGSCLNRGVTVKSIHGGPKSCLEHLLCGVHQMWRSRTNQRYSGRFTRGTTRGTTAGVNELWTEHGHGCQQCWGGEGRTWCQLRKGEFNNTVKCQINKGEVRGKDPGSPESEIRVV
jgi:hypothetical protein